MLGSNMIYSNFRLAILLAIFLFLVDRKLKKKAYDFSTFYLWVIYSSLYILLLYKCRHIPLGAIFAVAILFLSRQLSTPLDFCLNSVFTLITGKNTVNMRRMCQSLFNNHTILKHNMEVIPQYPTIWLLNYPQKNWIEYYTQSLLPQNYVFVANNKFGKILTQYYGSDRIHTINFSKSENYNTLKSQIKKILSRGTSVCMYFDTKVDYKGIKPHKYTLQTPRRGIFNIARELGVPVTPIVMDHLYISGGIIPPQNFQIYVGKSLKISDDRDIDNTILLFRKKLNMFLTDKFRGVNYL